MRKPKWWQVFRDDFEKRVFVGKDGRGGLCRTPHGYRWRTLAALATDAGLTTEATTVILVRYVAMGLVLTHDSGDKYGYWELVEPRSMGRPVTAPERRVSSGTGAGRMREE